MSSFVAVPSYAGVPLTHRNLASRITLITGHGVRSQEGVFGPDDTLCSVTVHTAPIRGASGNIDLVLELIVESSEIQRLQDELRTSRHRYQQLFDDAPCYITVQDRNLRIQAANRRFRQEFDSAPGGLCYQAYCNASRPCFGCPTLKTFEDGQPHQMELTVPVSQFEYVSTK